MNFGRYTAKCHSLWLQYYSLTTLNLIDLKVLMMQSFGSEEELLKALIQGNELAFRVLYVRYKKQLLYFSLKYIKDINYAEDIYQDAFAAIWINRESIDPYSPFAPYLYTIVRNRLLNQIARLDKRNELRKIIESKAIPLESEVEDNIVYKDLSKILEEAIGKLTPQQKTVFQMSREQMLVHKEIADKLGISTHTVQRHISDALTAIRMHIKKYNGIYADFIVLLVCLNFL